MGWWELEISFPSGIEIPLEGFSFSFQSFENFLCRVHGIIYVDDIWVTVCTVYPTYFLVIYSCPSYRVDAAFEQNKMRSHPMYDSMYLTLLSSTYIRETVSFSFLMRTMDIVKSLL